MILDNIVRKARRAIDAETYDVAALASLLSSIDLYIATRPTFRLLWERRAYFLRQALKRHDKTAALHIASEIVRNESY